MKIQIAFLLSLISLLSCTYDAANDPPIERNDMSACHFQLGYDKAETRTALIGKWDLNFLGCYSTPGDAAYVPPGEFVVEFFEDSTLVITEHGIITDTSKWDLIDGISGVFWLKSPGNFQLPGYIQFCDDYLEFNAAPVHACDKFFRKL